MNMRVFNWSAIAVVAQSFIFCWAVPVEVSLPARGRFCDNAPRTLAGTSLNPRSLSAGDLEIRKSTNTVLWCAPGSQTYVILAMTGQAVETAVLNMLNTAAGFVEQSIQQHGDIVIPGGGVRCDSMLSGISFVTQNSNNHQQTYGVLAAAIDALKDYMSRNYYGSASFHIYDGVNEVGLGKVGRGESIR